MIELPSVSGAWRATVGIPPELKISLLLLATVMSPLAVIAPEPIVPEVFMVAVPVIRPLLMVPALMIGLVSVLLIKVSVADSVTTTPLVGKVAVELTPVPPFVRPRMLATAAACDKSKAPKDGPETVMLSTWYVEPVAADTGSDP